MRAGSIQRRKVERRRFLQQSVAWCAGTGSARLTLSGARPFAGVTASGLTIAGAGLALSADRAVAAASATDEIRLRELYEKDLSFSPLAESYEDSVVAVRGFMAPPLKADAKFFVLTKRPMATCPFCSDAADWPNDIVAVYTKRAFRVHAFNVDIVVRGRLSLGDERDPDTGFFSRLRLVDAVVERV